MKAIEPGCLATVIVTPCPYPYRADSPGVRETLMTEVKVIEAIDGPEPQYRFCDHQWWMIEANGRRMAVECCLMRIDGHDEEETLDSVEALPA